MIRELDLDTLQLASGAHQPDHTFCIMEAVAYVAGEKWSDHPSCTSPIIASFLRSWNDSLNDVDRQMLRPLIPVIVGTRTSAKDETTRAWLMTDWLVRTFTPIWLRKCGLGDRADELEALPELTSTALAKAAQPIIDRARTEAAAAWAAAWDAAWAAAKRTKGDYKAKYAAARKAADAVLADALGETIVLLQKSALELVRRMAAVGR